MVIGRIPKTVAHSHTVDRFSGFPFAESWRHRPIDALKSPNISVVATSN